MLDAQYLAWLLQGAGATVLLSMAVITAALPLGVLACAARLSPCWPLATASITTLTVMRNSPLLIQLFFWYFAVPALLPPSLRDWLNTPHPHIPALFGLAWPPLEYLAAFIALTLYASAFIAEEFRAGIAAVAPGQWQAARALGLRRHQAWRHVVLPQALHLVRSPLLGQAMNTVKNTSLAMTIGVAELSYMARQVESQTFQAFQAFAVATVLYVAIIGLLEVLNALLARPRPTFVASGGSR